MSIHSDLFGWDYVWRNFADEKGGEAVEPAEGSGLIGLTIPAPEIAASIIFTPFVHHGKKKSKGTTVMAYFPPAGNFVFSLHTESWTGRVGKVFGMQDVQVQDALFDSKFLIQGNDVPSIQRLFEDIKLREAVLLQPPTQLRIETDASHYDPEWTVPAGNHVLVYRLDQLMEKSDQLQNVFEVVTAALKQLQILGVVRRKAATNQRFSSVEEASPVQSQRLHSPLLDRS